MKLDDILSFVKLSGFSNIQVQGSWVMISCPLAPFKHESGSDSSPSFGIKVDDNHASGYNCFACDTKGQDLRTLLNNMSLLTGNKYSQAYKFLIDNEYREICREKTSFGSTFGSVNMSKKKLDEENHPEPERPTISEDRLEKFSSEPHNYILDRGFSVETCKSWGISTDWSSSEPRVVFPVRNIEGELLAFSRRVVWNDPTCQWCGFNDPEKIKFGTSRREGEPNSSGGCPSCNNRWVWPKYQHSKGFKRNWYLYGEHMIDKSISTGVIVEGNLDPVWLWQCGVTNAVATLGSKVGTKWPNPKAGKPGEQIYLMSQLFGKVILLPDPDKAGRSWANEIRSGLEGRLAPDGKSIIKVFTCNLPKGTDPADLSARSVREILFLHNEVWRDGG